MSVVNKILKHYTKIPLWLTNMIAPLYYMLPESKRYGSVYSKEMAELKRIDKLTPQDCEKEKNESLRNIVEYAYNHVPYYKELFDGIGLSPKEIKEEKDLKKIPFLTKEIVVANKEKLLSDEFDASSLVHLTTSGSTGTPTAFYVQKESPVRERVYGVHMFEDMGYKSDSSRLVMRGKEFWALKNKGKNWQWDGFKRELSINIFDMTPESMKEYCRVIEKYKPDFAFGYMSAMYTLCKYIASSPKKLRHQFKGFLAISETVTEEQRNFVESVINARVFSFYGMSERIIIAGECKHSTEYHVEPMYGIAEIVDENGNVITDAGVTGELVGTGLLNYAMPLIRYKMGDMASWSDKTECGCGSCKKRIEKVRGRIRDVFVTKEKTLVPVTVNATFTQIMTNVTRYTFEQKEEGKVNLCVSVNSDFCENDKKMINDSFKKTYGDLLSLTIEVKDSIAPKPNGKFSIVNQYLDMSEYL